MVCSQACSLISHLHLLLLSSLLFHTQPTCFLTIPPTMKIHNHSRVLSLATASTWTSFPPSTSQLNIIPARFLQSLASTSRGSLVFSQADQIPSPGIWTGIIAGYALLEQPPRGRTTNFCCPFQPPPDVVHPF